MSCSSWKSRQNCVFLALFFAGVGREEAEATHAAIDATDDAPEALETASSQSEGECGGEGFGDDDDGSSLCPRPRPWPEDFLAAFFGACFGMTMMLTLRCLAWL